MTILLQAKPEAALNRPRVLFLGSGYAGHRTRFHSLQSHLESDPRIQATWQMVSGWQPMSRLEQTRILPRSVRSRVRIATETLPLLQFPRPDVIWTSAGTDIAPLVWPMQGPLRRPLVLDLDWTLQQREELALWYFDRQPRSGVVAALNRARERALWSRVTLFTPWSEWAADSLRASGVEDDRIRVLPPGVDIEAWQPAPKPTYPDRAPLRLLFVGGDFRRKGGELLLTVMRSLAGTCHLDVVTREAVEPTPGVTVHRAEANSPELKELYQRADLFVLPSFAECFGIATLEAMASGLPVLVSDRGASREIVEHGRSGWVAEPTEQELHDRLLAAAADRSRLRFMGTYARATVKARFDGRRNDSVIADLLLSLTTLAGETSSSATIPVHRSPRRGNSRN